jgi:hypothetical protein
MSEYVSNTLAQLIANLGDSCIGGTAVRAVIASIFHQRYGSSRRTKDVISGAVDSPVESVVHGSN